MIEYKIQTGFFSETPRQYNGENIFQVKETRRKGKSIFHLLENGQWIRSLGNDQYTTDWTMEECWGRVQEIVIDENTKKRQSVRDLGFMILCVDREKGLRLFRENPNKKEVTAKKKAVVDQSLCMCCRICIKFCHKNMLKISNNHATVSDNCIGCGKCLNICPFDAISMK